MNISWMIGTCSHLLMETSQNCLSGTVPSSSFIYICSEKFPQTLLPNAERFLLASLHAYDYSSLQASLKCLASSKQTQLRMLDAEGVANLLPHVLHVRTDATCSLPLDRFKIFWWVKNHKLELFANKFVVPIVHETSFFPSVNVAKLELNSPIVCVPKYEFLPVKMEIKLGVEHTQCYFLKHMFYLKSLSTDGILTAIKIQR